MCFYMTPADLPGAARHHVAAGHHARRRTSASRAPTSSATRWSKSPSARRTTEIEFRLRARVERAAPQAPAMDIAACSRRLPAEIAAMRSLGAGLAASFSRPTARAFARRRNSTAYALAQIDAGHDDARRSWRPSAGRIDRDMTFDPGSTQVDTPPEEAFARRHGVCQDFTPHHDRLPARHRHSGSLCQRLPAHHSAAGPAAARRRRRDACLGARLVRTAMRLGRIRSDQRHARRRPAHRRRAMAATMATWRPSAASCAPPAPRTARRPWTSCRWRSPACAWRTTPVPPPSPVETYFLAP